MTRDSREDEAGTTPEDAAREKRSYLMGFAVSLALTLVAFAAVIWDLGGQGAVFVILGVTALLQIAAQFRWFLHIGLRGQAREDLQLILFTALILSLMAGGTIFILANLAGRMH
jgi:cytochrome o ubiquinol oxidase subunit IV